MARAETSGITDGHENVFAKSVDWLRAHLLRAYLSAGPGSLVAPSHHRTQRLDTERTPLALAAGCWSGTETAGRRLRCAF